MSAVASGELGRARSNSFNFVPVRDVARASGQPCPLRQAPERVAELFGAGAAVRAVFLRLPDRMRLFSTATRDFEERELGQVKHQSGQLYADVSSKVAPDDFSRDLVKLRLRGECAACELRAACAGCYSAVKDDVFGRDDSRVREILRSLAGKLLDVGAGEGPYLSELDPARVDYLGIDPDARRIELLRARHPWARFSVGTLDTLAAESDGYDHVLVLRSYNHLANPARELAHAASHLRPGGTLLVVDNVAFGLVRSRDHAARAEHSSAAFEHFRNDSADDAHSRLSELGLELIERHDVGPDTSNQWLLHYRKPHA